MQAGKETVVLREEQSRDLIKTRVVLDGEAHAKEPAATWIV